MAKRQELLARRRREAAAAIKQRQQNHGATLRAIPRAASRRHQQPIYFVRQHTRPSPEIAVNLRAPTTIHTISHPNIVSFHVETRRKSATQTDKIRTRNVQRSARNAPQKISTRKHGRRATNRRPDLRPGRHSGPKAAPPADAPAGARAHPPRTRLRNRNRPVDAKSSPAPRTSPQRRQPQTRPSPWPQPARNIRFRNSTASQPVRHRSYPRTEQIRIRNSPAIGTDPNAERPPAHHQAAGQTSPRAAQTPKPRARRLTRQAKHQHSEAQPRSTRRARPAWRRPRTTGGRACLAPTAPGPAQQRRWAEQGAGHHQSTAG